MGTAVGIPTDPEIAIGRIGRQKAVALWFMQREWAKASEFSVEHI
jgi:hypothetical protein